MARKPPGKRSYTGHEKAEIDTYFTKKDRTDRDRAIREQQREAKTEAIYQARGRTEYKKYYDAFLSHYKSFGGSKEEYQGLLDDADSYALNKIGIKYHNPGRGNGGGRVGNPEVRLMTAGQINKALDKIDAEDSKLTDQMIADGRGYERPSEYLNKTDPLSRKIKANHDKRMELQIEMGRRYGPGVPSRLPKGFGPIKSNPGET